MAQPGDKCPKGCGGQLIVRSSRDSGLVQLRYMRCNCCGCDGGKQIVPVTTVFSRKRVTTA